MHAFASDSAPSPASRTDAFDKISAPSPASRTDAYRDCSRSRRQRYALVAPVILLAFGVSCGASEPAPRWFDPPPEFLENRLADDHLEVDALSYEFRADFSMEPAVVQTDARLRVPAAAETVELHGARSPDSVEVDGIPALFSFSTTKILVDLPRGHGAEISVRTRSTSRATLVADDGRPALGRNRRNGSEWVAAMPQGRYFMPGIRDVVGDGATVRWTALSPAGAFGLANGTDAGTGTLRGTVATPLPNYGLYWGTRPDPPERISAEFGLLASPTASHLRSAAESLPAGRRAFESMVGKLAFDKIWVMETEDSNGISAMESSGAINIPSGIVSSGALSMKHVLLHELAHHVFGNDVRYATWGDAWIGESFAEYYSLRLLEELGEAGYAEEQWAEKARYAAARPLVLSAGDPASIRQALFYDDAHIYTKGPLALRWLERRIGRRIFDEFIQQFVAKHRGTAVTSTLVALELRGRSLDVDGWFARFIEGDEIPN